MRMIIVEDEILQIETMEEYLREIDPEAEIVSFQDPSKALEFVETQTADVAFLDIKMAGGMDGIQLASQMKQRIQTMKIIFCTGYSEYAVDAFRIHADGYLCKPIMMEDLVAEMNYLFQMDEPDGSKKPFLHTFGNFDIFVDGKPVLFKRQKSKEVLAWLTDRKGTWVTNSELIAVIWDDYRFDTPMVKYASLLVREMMHDLERYGIGHIVERERGKIRLCVEAVDCDYLSLLMGKTDAENQFRGEYMTQYSWGESTLSNLLGNLYS